ncbi:MAG TPA: hypothetical protein VLA04_01975 [Verrucomicrobiae bacterium]|nr:hypothetical protein [Verrucomicrobiae bacterium]
MYLWRAAITGYALTGLDEKDAVGFDAIALKDQDLNSVFKPLLEKKGLLPGLCIKDTSQVEIAVEPQGGFVAFYRCPDSDEEAIRGSCGAVDETRHWEIWQRGENEVFQLVTLPEGALIDSCGSLWIPHPSWGPLIFRIESGSDWFSAMTNLDERLVQIGMIGALLGLQGDNPLHLLLHSSDVTTSQEALRMQELLGRMRDQLARPSFG